MHTSPAGRVLIENYEGLRLDAYPDPATGGDPWTIGYGDTGPDVVAGLTITKVQADQMLSDRLAQEFEPAVARAIGSRPTTQAQFDAMVSLSYNIGAGAFGHSSVAREHAAGNYLAAANDFILWNRADGRVLGALTRRRREERALYLSGGSAVDLKVNTSLPPAIDYADMQRRLNAWGIDPALVVDGRFGPLTRDAVRLFQAEEKLPATGLPDAATLVAITATAKESQP